MANTDLGQMVFKITGDNSGLKRTLGESETQATKTAGVFSGLGAKIAGAFSIAAAVAFGKAVVKAASDAEETANKFGVVFSSISAEANASAGAIAAAYGMSNQAAKELMSTTGNVLQSFGMQQKASFDLSASITTLSADLVSFTNYEGGVEGASRAITSALLGEREALKGLGIALSDADLKSYAASQGKVWEQLTKATQAQMTYDLILKKSKNAVGDFSRSMDGYANSTRTFEASWSNFMAAMGKSSMPVLSGIQRGLATLVDGFTKTMEMYGPGADKLKTTYAELVLAQTKLNEAADNLRENPKSPFAQGKLIIAREALDKLADKYNKLLKDKPKIDKPVLEKIDASGDFGTGGTGDKNDKKGPELGADITAATGKYVEQLDIIDQITLAQQAMIEKENEGKTATEQWAESMDKLGAVTASVANALSAASQLSEAITAKKIRQNEEEMNAELKKNGLLEADEISKAKTAYDLLTDAQKADANNETVKALNRAKIEEKYAKKRRMLEYEGAMDSWGFQLAQATAAAPLAILNAFASGNKFGVGWGLASAAIAATAAGMQVAAVSVAKPEKPKFANGGIVPGNSFFGDNVPVQANSGEMVLNKEQQGRLFAQANGHGGGMMRVAPISKESILDVLFRASQNGELFISQRAVVSR